MARKAAILVWAPITLDGAVSGDKVNEVERIRILSREFAVYAFVLASFRSIGRRKEYVNNWFRGVSARIVVIPLLDYYGTRIFSTIAAGVIVGLSLIALRLARKIDLIIARGSVPSLPLILAAKVAGVHFLFNALSVPFLHREFKLTLGMLMRNRAIVYVFKLADYFLLQTADYVGVASRACAQDLVAVSGSGYHGKIVILPFPVPDQLFSYPLDVTARADTVLVYNGSLSGRYEFSHLISAVEEMNNAGQHASLVVYSSQQGRRMLRAQASARASFLTFGDQVPKHELIEALRQATAVVIPTSNRVERILPTKAIEAMALGVPVIISNPQDAEIFRDGETCIVVHENTVQGWREAIQRATMPQCRERIVRGARAKAETFRSIWNLSVVSNLLRGNGPFLNELKEMCQKEQIPVGFTGFIDQTPRRET